MIADEVKHKNLFSYSFLNSLSESNWSGEDWRAHVGLPKFWSRSGYSHDWPFYVQRLSNGCCDMFKVDSRSHKSIFESPFISREVSERLGGYFSTFGGNPVACAIGLTVLEVIPLIPLISKTILKLSKNAGDCQ